MTHTTEQERASLRAFIEMAEREGFDTAHQWYEAKGWVFFSPSTADCWRYWQAARRAPVVPQGWKITEEMHVAAVKVLHRASGVDGLPQRMVDAMLAAAPQPPEAAQLDDIGVVDMAQAVDSKEAASVQLPEPVYTLRIRGRLHDHTPALPAFDLEGGEYKLYTEQQVRQLLAAHGIKEQST